MRKSSLRLALALSAFFVLPITIAACGGSDDSTDVPSNAVAVIDGTPITKTQFDHFLELAARGAASGGAVVPDPPSYTKCIAALRRQSRPSKGQSGPSDATLRARCKQQDETLRRDAMTAMIQERWLAGEAKTLGVVVTDAQVDRQLAEAKRQSFPTDKEWKRFLSETGMSEDDARDRIRAQLVLQRVTEKIQDSAAPVTDQQVADYFRRNREQFALPERRDLELILTRDEAKANEAKAAIEGGTSWAAAAKKYSNDPASSANGGKLLGVAKGQQDRALDQAAFEAEKGVIVGPVKGQFGWYLVRVTKVSPPKQDTLDESKAQIKQQLTQQAQQQKVSTFAADFQKRWKADTVCRTGYIVELCKNAPKQNTTSTAGGTVAGSSTNGG